MGFDEKGNQYFTFYDHTFKKNKIWPDIVKNSSKIVHLLDMCGHEKYLKTTMRGLTGMFPDYAMLFIGGNMGISRMTKEHLAISLTLDMPLFVVITKVDIAPQTVLTENLKKIGTILKQQCGKIPILVNDQSDMAKIAEKVKTGKVTPIFQISNSTGAGVDKLRSFLGKLEKADQLRLISNASTNESITTQFVIDDCYHSKGLGMIFCGSVLKGQVEIGQTLMFGPDRQGNFKTIKVKDIHMNRVPIASATAGM